MPIFVGMTVVWSKDVPGLIGSSGAGRFSRHDARTLVIHVFVVVAREDVDADLRRHDGCVVDGRSGPGCINL